MAAEPYRIYVGSERDANDLADFLMKDLGLLPQIRESKSFPSGHYPGPMHWYVEVLLKGGMTEKDVTTAVQRWVDNPSKPQDDLRLAAG